MEGWRDWVMWVGATAVGWLVGLVGAFVVSSVAVQPLIGRETNLVVGLCIGAGVGWAQVRVMRGRLGLGAAWVVGSGMMMALPFVAAVILDAMAVDSAATLYRGGMLGAGVVGGLGGAVVQAGALRGHTSRPALWVVGAAVSWGVTTWVGQMIGLVASGVLLGVIGGALLLVLVRQWPGAGEATGVRPSASGRSAGHAVAGG